MILPMHSHFVVVLWYCCTKTVASNVSNWYTILHESLPGASSSCICGIVIILYGLSIMIVGTSSFTVERNMMQPMIHKLVELYGTLEETKLRRIIISISILLIASWFHRLELMLQGQIKFTNYCLGDTDRSWRSKTAIELHHRVQPEYSSRSRVCCFCRRCVDY